jgi:spore germination cell wall hydrolase CwlJ-like protein
MASKTPPFPIIGDPGTWPELTLLAGTILLESEGEPFDGQVGVGCVVMARVKTWGLTIYQVLLGPEGKAYGEGKAFEPFSCWNDNYMIRARARLDTAPDAAMESAWKAAAIAFWGLAPDPTLGATFYLNEAATRRIREGTLPDWFKEERVTVRLGRHTFVKA